MDSGIEYRIMMLEKRVDKLENTLTENIKELYNAVDDIRSMMIERREKESEFEKMILQKITEHNGYIDKFVTKEEMFLFREELGRDLGNIYDRISEIEKRVEVLGVGSKKYFEGQSFIIKYWSEILSMILAIILILKYFGV